MNQATAQERLKAGQKCFFDEPPDLDCALTYFHEVTQLAPDWAEGFFWYASAQLRKSGVATAAAAFRRAIELDPADSRPHLALGTAFAQADRLDEAARCLRAGLVLKPPYGEADSRVALARVLEKLGRMNEALGEWHAVAKMEATYPSYDEPIEEAKKALQRHGRGAG